MKHVFEFLTFAFLACESRYKQNWNAKNDFSTGKKGGQKQVQNIFLNICRKSIAQNYVKKIRNVFCYFTIFVSLMNSLYILRPCWNPPFRSTLPTDPKDILICQLQWKRSYSFEGFQYFCKYIYSWLNIYIRPFLCLLFSCRNISLQRVLILVSENFFT